MSCFDDFYDSFGEDSCDNDGEKVNLPPATQAFTTKDKDVEEEEVIDETMDENDDFMKVTQHINKRTVVNQNVLKEKNKQSGQTNGSTKQQSLPSELSLFFEKIGLHFTNSKEYSSCVGTVDASQEYKTLNKNIVKYFDNCDIDKFINSISEVLNLEDVFNSFQILEIFVRPVKVNEIYNNVFLQILLSVEALQHKLFDKIIKFFYKSKSSDDELIQKTCGYYIDLLKDVEEIYDHKKIFEIVSNIEYDEIAVSFRDELAGFIYQFVQDFEYENEFYRILMKWLRKSGLEECETFRLALLHSIKRVSSNSINIKSECFVLLSSINIFDADVMNEVINYTCAALTADNKNQIMLYLLALRQNLRLNKYKDSDDFDKIICNIFHNIMILVTSYGINGLTLILNVLNETNAKKISATDFGILYDENDEGPGDLSFNDGESVDSDDEDGEEKKTIVKHKFSDFDYILSLVTISENMSLPVIKLKEVSKLMAAQIECYSSSFDDVLNFMNTMLLCEEFMKKYLDGFIFVADYFLKDGSSIVKEFGMKLFTLMFSNLPLERDTIVELLVDHIISDDDVNYSALLTINLIVQKCSNEFINHIDYFLERSRHQCINFEPERLRTYFKILVSLSILCREDDVEEKISSIFEQFDSLFSNMDEASFRVALLANIVRVTELIRKNPEEYSSDICKILEKLDCYSNYMPQYRAYYLLEFSMILKDSHEKFEKPSNDLIEYMNKKVFNILKTVYFVPLNQRQKYKSSQEDSIFDPMFKGYHNEDAQFMLYHRKFLLKDLKDVGIWNVEMLSPIIPMIQFIFQVLRLMHKWKLQDEKTSLENLYFVFEANIDLVGINFLLEKEDICEKELLDLRMSILFLLDYISNLLNTFSKCRNTAEHNEIIQKKYRLYVKLEHLFTQIINEKFKTCFVMPRILSNGYYVSSNNILLFGLKISNLRPKKKSNKSEGNGEDNNEDEIIRDVSTPELLGPTLMENKTDDNVKSYHKVISITKILDYITPFSINVLIKCVDVFLDLPHVLSTVINGLDLAIGRIEDELPDAFFPFNEKEDNNNLKEVLSDCVTAIMSVFDHSMKKLISGSDDLLDKKFAEQSLKIMLHSMKCNNKVNLKDYESNKKKLIEKIYDFIVKHSALSAHNNDIIITVCNYFMKEENCIISSSTMGVTIVQMLLNFIDDNELLRLQLAKKCIDMLDSNWPENCATTTYNKEIGKILEMYFNLISPKYQIISIIFIVTKRLSFYAPVKEQEELKDIGFEYQTNFGKLALDNLEEECPFKAATQKTFSTMYNVCFTALNIFTQKVLVKKDLKDEEIIKKTLDIWFLSIACFSKLITFINISKFRNKTILSTVIKEGKKYMEFLNSNKSSFLTLITNEHQFRTFNEKFYQIFDKMEAIHDILNSHHNDINKKLSGSTLRFFPSFICSLEAFKRRFQNISILYNTGNTPGTKPKKRPSEPSKNIKRKEPKIKRNKLSKVLPATIERHLSIDDNNDDNMEH